MGPRLVCMGCETYYLQGIGPNQGQLEYINVVNNLTQKIPFCAQLQHFQEQPTANICFFFVLGSIRFMLWLFSPMEKQERILYW